MIDVPGSATTLEVANPRPVPGTPYHVSVGRTTRTLTFDRIACCGHCGGLVLHFHKGQAGTPGHRPCAFCTECVEGLSWRSVR